LKLVVHSPLAMTTKVITVRHEGSLHRVQIIPADTEDSILTRIARRLGCPGAPISLMEPGQIEAVAIYEFLSQDLIYEAVVLGAAQAALEVVEMPAHAMATLQLQAEPVQRRSASLGQVPAPVLSRHAARLEEPRVRARSTVQPALRRERIGLLPGGSQSQGHCPPVARSVPRQHARRVPPAQAKAFQPQLRVKSEARGPPSQVGHDPALASAPACVTMDHVCTLMARMSKTPHSECRCKIWLLSIEHGIKSRLRDHVENKFPRGRVSGTVQRSTGLTKVLLEGSNEDVMSVMVWMRDTGARGVQVANYKRDKQKRTYRVFKMLKPDLPPPRLGYSSELVSEEGDTSSGQSDRRTASLISGK